MKLSLFFVTLCFSPIVFALSDIDVLTQIKNLGTDLQKELQAGMKKTPVEALEICNIKAPIIEGKYKKEELKIGRVSLKNRNPNNVPKEWMQTYIKGFQTKSIKAKYVSVQISEHKNGLLMPILTMPVCLECHGTAVKPSLYKEILKKYPNDKAIGYKVGDIRGFFWAEYNKAK